VSGFFASMKPNLLKLPFRFEGDAALQLLPGTGRGTMRSMVEGAHASMLAALAPLHRRSGGPPPRTGEEL
jgi:hypothetical protein